jgi:hypothetical protein
MHMTAAHLRLWVNVNGCVWAAARDGDRSPLYTSRKSTFESATYAELPRTDDGLQLAQ